MHSCTKKLHKGLQMPERLTIPNFDCRGKSSFYQQKPFTVKRACSGLPLPKPPSSVLRVLFSVYPVHVARCIRMRAACLALQAAPSWCSRAVAGASGGCSSWSPPSRPRRGRRRDSVGERGGIQQPARHRRWGSGGLPSRSIPQPHHSGPVPRSGTISHATQYPTAALYTERYILCLVVSHSGTVSRSNMVSLGMGLIVVATIPRLSNEAARATDVAGNVPCKLTRDAQALLPAAPSTNSDGHRDDDLVNGAHAEEN